VRNVGAVGKQHLDHVVVAVEGGVVQGRPPVYGKKDWVTGSLGLGDWGFVVT